MECGNQPRQRNETGESQSAGDLLLPRAGWESESRPPITAHARDDHGASERPSPAVAVYAVHVRLGSEGQVLSNTAMRGFDMRKRESGFTLVELLVVMFIICILMVV